MSACPAKYTIYSDDLVRWINEFEVGGLREPRLRALEARGQHSKRDERLEALPPGSG